MTKYRPQRYIETDDGSPTAQEHRVARKTGGKRVGGSGSHPMSKSDVRDVPGGGYGFQVECKKTEHASIRITKKWLDKICREANAVQKWPALAIEIQGGEEDPLGVRDWIMIPARVFQKLQGDG